jgi:hypothetical protein
MTRAQENTWVEKFSIKESEDIKSRNINDGTIIPNVNKIFDTTISIVLNSK